jgi:sugar O-acyltransferase (sialic acid O-acetyltransferase NeuD family)
MQRPVIVLGGGGHAKVVISILLLQGRHVLGYCGLEEEGEPILGVRRLGREEIIFERAAGDVSLANGIGTPGRRAAYIKFTDKGYSFDPIVHPSAVAARDIGPADGAQIMAGVVIQPGTVMGVDVIINSRASVDHDCVLADHVHVGPGAVLCGGVRLESGVEIGAGATVIQGRSIGADSIIGAGAVVIEDIPPGVTAVGVPARVIKRAS